MAIFKFVVNSEYFKKILQINWLVSTCERNGDVVDSKESIICVGKTNQKRQKTSNIASAR